MIVLLTESGVPIRWQCSVCDDEGMISNWEDSPFDLRRRRLTLAKGINEIVIPDEALIARLLLVRKAFETLLTKRTFETPRPGRT
jgi:hypothetical protein